MASMWEMTGLAFAAAMAMIFAVACAHAMRDWPGFTAEVVQYRLVPDPVARGVSYGLPPVQALAAVLLLMAPFWGAALGLALLAMFSVAIVVNLARGRSEIACGCGGAAGQMLSWGLVARNGVLALWLAVVAVAPRGVIADAASAIGVAGAASFLAATYFAADQMLANAQAFARARA